MRRPPGPSVRLRLALSYAAVVTFTGVLLLGVVWLFLLRYVPEGNIDASGGMVPNRSDLLRAFAPRAFLVLLFVLAVGLVGGWLLAGRMLAPLDRITAATRAVSAGALGHRILLPGRDDEFRELADAFDTMLERVEAQVAEQQRFAANASHELRTPLAITQALLEVARDDPAPDASLLVERLGAVNQRAIALTEALLVLSRADQRAFEREEVDLSLLAEQAAEDLLPLAERSGVSVEVTGDVAAATGSPALLLQLATNLIHNAIVHNAIVHNAGRRNSVAHAAATEGDSVPGGETAGGCVWVHTHAGPGISTLTVENTGQRLDPHAVATLTEPFQRGAARIHDTHREGLGLGLAIVASIVRAHDGALRISPREAGGLRIDVTLPAR